jgi:predicted O-methyltransferase YrrM
VELCLEQFRAEHHTRLTRFENNWFVEGAEIEVIFGLIKKHGIKSVLEIGINRGETAKKLLDACPEIERYMGVEITQDAASSMNSNQQGERERAGKDVADVAKKDKRLKTFVSKNGSKDFQSIVKYDLVFIDGNHAPDWVKHDIALAKKLDAKVIVWHDYGTEPGVTQAVDGLGERCIYRVFGTKIAYQLRGISG